jgi:hypothetical protein
MVLRGKSFHRMEVQVKHILAVDSREACVPLFRRIIPDTDRFESLQRAQGRASFGSLSFVGLAQQLTLPISSAIIQDIMALREAGQAAVAYFYFDFRDTDKQNLRNALPSLLTQLSARSDHCCDLLSRVYKAHDDGALKPNSSTMITCLNEMLTLPNQGPIYIILDALDECPNTSGIPSARKQVLNLIKDLVGLRLSNLHLCVTSRPVTVCRTDSFSLAVVVVRIPWRPYLCYLRIDLLTFPLRHGSSYPMTYPSPAQSADVL